MSVIFFCFYFIFSFSLRSPLSRLTQSSTVHSECIGFVPIFITAGKHFCTHSLSVCVRTSDANRTDPGTKRNEEKKHAKSNAICHSHNDYCTHQIDSARNCRNRICSTRLQPILLFVFHSLCDGIHFYWRAFLSSLSDSLPTQTNLWMCGDEDWIATSSNATLWESRIVSWNNWRRAKYLLRQIDRRCQKTQQCTSTCMESRGIRLSKVKPDNFIQVYRESSKKRKTENIVSFENKEMRWHWRRNLTATMQ